jgi:Prophage tail length tape measure protein
VADDVQVKFGVNLSELSPGVNDAKSILAGFSDEVLKMNPQLVEAVKGLEGVAGAAGKAAEATAQTSHATAGVTREFLVLGHEALTGNFARMAGSSLVLANRMNLLGDIVSRITPAIAGNAAVIALMTYDIYEWITAQVRLAETFQEVNAQMALHSQGMSYNSALILDQITSLRVWGDESESTAEKIVTEFARVGNVSAELKNKLITMVPDFAASVGEEGPKAAEMLIKMFSDPVRAARELGEQNIITASDVEKVTLAFRNGENAAGAQQALMDALGPKLDNFRLNSVGPLSAALDKLHGAWVELESGWILSDVPKLPQLDATQKPQAAQQDAQNAVNAAIQRGNDIEQRSGLLVARKNELLGKQAGLIAAANAAETQGDSAGAARFRQDAAEVQEQIDNLHAKGAKQDVEAEMSAIQEKLAIDKIYLGEKKDLLQAEVDAGKLSKAQEIAALKDFTNQEYALSSQALQEELNLSGLSIVERQRVNNEILTLQAQHERDMAALDLQAAAAQQAAIKKTQEEYKSFFDTIDRDMDQVLKGILQGTQTWQQAEARLFSDLALSVIEDISKILLKATALKAINLLGGAGGNLSKAIGGEVPQALGGTQNNGSNPLTALLTTLATVITGNTAAQTLTGSITEASNAITQTTGTVVTGLSTATLANTTATIANTTAEGSSSGGGFFSSLFAAIPHYDTGTSFAPGGLSILHPGEIVIPPAQSAALRSGGAGFGGASGAGGNFTINVNAIDTQTGAQFLKNNASVIAQTMSGQMRNFNPRLTG